MAYKMAEEKKVPFGVPPGRDPVEMGTWLRTTVSGVRIPPRPQPSKGGRAFTFSLRLLRNKGGFNLLEFNSRSQPVNNMSPKLLSDLAREVNHRPYDPTNWERINRLLFGSDSSFPNAAYNSPLYCALQVCFFPRQTPPRRPVEANCAERDQEIGWIMERNAWLATTI
nr:unnamed protein product [Digitaria exilis]